MSRNSHIIQRAIVELMLPSADNAFAAQNRAADVFKREILPMIEKVLDELDEKDKVIRLEKLTLDVNLKQADLSDPVFLERIKAKLRKQVERAIEEANDNPQTLKEFGKIKKLSAEHTDEELFLYMLRHGRLPWWTGTRDKIELNTVAERVLQKPSAEFRAMILAQMKSSELMKRLVHKLSPENFLSVVALISAGTSYASEVIGEFSKMIRLYPLGNGLEKRFLEELLSGAAQNKKLYEIISGFIMQQGDVRLVEYIYLQVAKNRFDGDLSIPDEIKRSLAAADLHYEGKVRNVFSPADVAKYFNGKGKAGMDAGSNDPDTNDKKQSSPVSSEETPFSLLNIEENETYHMHNAGVIILAAFLPVFFGEMDLLEGEKFRSPEHAERAAFLIQHLATGEESGFEEHGMLLNKVLCGIDIAEPLTLEFELKEKEREEGRNLLNAVASHWSALRGSSGESMRQTFFMREASMEPQSNGWNLRIEKQTFDILVDKLPWGISLIRLPWMQGALFVDW